LPLVTKGLNGIYHNCGGVGGLIVWSSLVFGWEVKNWFVCCGCIGKGGWGGGWFVTYGWVITSKSWDIDA